MICSSRRDLAHVFVFVLILSNLGCGKNGPERVRVSGTVTYAGQPLELGRIVFEPDASQGNQGPEGFAPIENGRYDTASPHCRGPVPGASIVRIDGFELSNVQDAAASAKAVFSAHEERIDVPQRDVVRDFTIPTSQKR